MRRWADAGVPRTLSRACVFPACGTRFPEQMVCIEKARFMNDRIQFAGNVTRIENDSVRGAPKCVPLNGLPKLYAYRSLKTLRS
jgi:hypothetical protein